MRYDKSTNRIYVRQSWIGSYLICPQRGRYDMTMPQLRQGSDATAIGTGIHSAIEEYLNGKLDDSIDTFIESCRTNVLLELDRPNLRKSSISNDMDSLLVIVESMAVGWWDTIRPHVPLGGVTEYKFACPISDQCSPSSPELWLEGTMDYLAPDGTIWDWKTAGRSYSPKEKQKQSHQATSYVLAARKLGLVDTSEPTLFRFGVMLKQHTPKAHIVTVSRDAGQVEWLERQVASIVTTASTMSTGVDWMMNDQHNLCSSMWCDYWNLCKGAHWEGSTMDPPSQEVPVAIVAKPSTDQ